MEDIYWAAGLSRQSVHRYERLKAKPDERISASEVVQIAQKVRREHLPGAGARAIYGYITDKLPTQKEQLKGWGKHRFEKICLEKGLRIDVQRFVPKTTQRGDFVFDNLIAGTQINDINRIWVSDISYIYGSPGGLLGYMTSLLDVYSRRLLGLTFSQTMHAAVTSQEVLNQAFDVRAKARLENLIFHSDAGKQYIKKDFLESLRTHQIKSSMAKNCFENPFAEAFNDTLKNHLLHDQIINSFQQLKAKETFIKDAYNLNKKHSSLPNMTPCEYEYYILNLEPCQRTTLKIKVID